VVSAAAWTATSPIAKVIARSGEEIIGAHYRSDVNWKTDTLGPRAGRGVGADDRLESFERLRAPLPPCRRITIAQSLYAVGAALCVASTSWSIAFIVLIQISYVLGLPWPLRRRSSSGS